MKIVQNNITVELDKQDIDLLYYCLGTFAGGGELRDTLDKIWDVLESLNPRKYEGGVDPETYANILPQTWNDFK